MEDKNIMSKAGWSELSDQEYIDTFGLDPNKDINRQMFDVVEKQNYEAYLRAGMDEKQARTKAADKKKEAMQASKHLL